ncbi:Ig-like domain-containing protein [Robiginitalea biformata]|uniref:VCBS protein n=1 Tax=Robiginitalea biformata (strain ATCC BAA-864 / DSM 15991 / KCTC 12146 / HTCC2501) TaxID=313596 RepID=A4CQ79_ROBBH|nr:gliding motility-associated C-terminal domain-containing protein [Robiginitalea biformata]EAR14164.1 VCBS protein [Robiginitalea biformata HTCC2501]
MKLKLLHTAILSVGLFLIAGISQLHGQFLLQAPNAGDESNYRWYEASDTSTVLSTDFFYEATQPGVYFATYDGTLCGSNATGYFILTDCNSPDNEVTLDISANVNGGATVTWSPAVGGDPLRPMVIADQTVRNYTASVIKAGVSSPLPEFTVVCMQQAAVLVDDTAITDEDVALNIPIYANDSSLPQDGSLTATDPAGGTVTIDQNGTPNDPTDDILTYTPDPDFNGTDSFDYTVCNTSGDCSTGTVTVTVNPIVDAFDDAIATNENEATIADILANDNDIPTSGSLTTTAPANGTLALDDGGTPGDPSDDTVTYTPDPGFTGSDSFTYTLCDALGNCSTATVTVLVNAVGLDIDADNDGIVDSFEDLDLDGDGNPATNPTDTDGDGVPDYLDIDSDDDGVPDNIEGQSTAGYIPPGGTDANMNGLDDVYENGGAVGIVPEDTDGDGIPDYVDSDSDNDGVPDSVEANDIDMDGFAETVIVGSDKDGDGLDDGFEGTTAIDINVNDGKDDPINDWPDTDGDGELDYRDTDDDGDQILTAGEDANGDGIFYNDDMDGDGIPDYLEPNSSAEDLEVFNVVTPNGDGAHDYLTIAGIQDFPNNTIRIYNRWGVLVFTTRAYDTQGNVFDGTSQGRATIAQDNKLPVGTYFYILDFEDENGVMRTRTGYLYLNR